MLLCLKTLIKILEYTPMSKMISDEESSKTNKSKKAIPATDAEIPQESEENQEDESNLPVPSKEYDYLLSMPLWSLSQEKVDSLLNQKETKRNEILLLEKMRVEEIWINDMEEFLKVLDVSSKLFIISYINDYKKNLCIFNFIYNSIFYNFILGSGTKRRRRSHEYCQSKEK